MAEKREIVLSRADISAASDLICGLFTREDVEVLREEEKHQRWHAKGGGSIPTQLADMWQSLADRLELLLPPEDG